MKRRKGSWILPVVALLYSGPTPLSAEMLYTNGSIITNPGAGFHGADVSQASDDFNTLGFSVDAPTRLGDDFVVPAGGWRVSEVTVNAYIPGSSASISPFSAITLNLWRGEPQQPASQLVATSTSLTGNAFSDIYRVSFGAANLGNTQRPVYNLTASFPDVELSAGEHWIDYTVTGSGGITFSPMLMTGTPTDPLTVVGNARRKLDPSGSWVMLFGGLNAQGVDFPFTISGTPIPEPALGSLAAAAALLLARRHRQT